MYIVYNIRGKYLYIEFIGVVYILISVENLRGKLYKISNEDIRLKKFTVKMNRVFTIS